MRNAWKVADLRKKILFTFFILLIYRLGSAIPVPNIHTDVLNSAFSQYENTLFGMMNMMSGGAFSLATLFALGIQPYINSSIIMQLLTIAIPALERMQKDEGEEGRKKIASMTRYVTVALGLLLGFAYYMMIRNAGALADEGIWTAIVIILSFTAGSAFVMWLGEQITEFGIGNGISVILFASIVSRLPAAISSFVSGVSNWANGVEITEELKAQGVQSFGPWWIAIILVGMVLMIAFVVFMTKAERRIPVQYSKRVVGRKMYGGQSSHIPIKVNMSGVMPIIFAQSIASFPATIAAFFPTPEEGTFWANFLDGISNESIVYAIILLVLIVAFSYFYAAIQFSPIEIANNLRKNGGFIPGFRAGKPTADFIAKVLNKITLFGAFFLGIIAILPIIVNKFVSINGLQLGGTSLLIVVGVALETVQQMESQMMMRHYKGFLE